MFAARQAKGLRAGWPGCCSRWDGLQRGWCVCVRATVLLVAVHARTRGLRLTATVLKLTLAYVCLLCCCCCLPACRPSWSLAGVVAVIVSGLLLLVRGEADFDTTGFVLVMSASCMSGLRFTLTQVLLHGNRGNNSSSSSSQQEAGGAGKGPGGDSHGGCSSRGRGVLVSSWGRCEWVPVRACCCECCQLTGGAHGVSLHSLLLMRRRVDQRRAGGADTVLTCADLPACRTCGLWWPARGAGAAYACHVCNNTAAVTGV